MPVHILTPAPLHPLTNALSLHLPGELISFTGGGGKSSLLFALGRELAAAGHRVVATSTTRLATAQLQLAPACCLASDLRNGGRSLDQNLQAHRFCLVVGDVGPEKVTGVPLDLPAALLARPAVDAVLVEADGARMLPVKAPAPHEPALPPQTTLLVPVVGIDALSAPLQDVAHRPRRLAALLGLSSLREILTPTHVARLLTSPQGALRHAPPHARVIPFINKVENDEQLAQALEIARLVFAGATDPRLQCVLIGAVQTSRPLRAIVAP